MRFIGQYRCKLDSNGRVKLPPAVLADFACNDTACKALVLFCLPEGALALFTTDIWEQLRSQKTQETPELLDSFELRRKARRIAAFTDCQEISAQGRITLPPLFRDKLDFKDGDELIIVGNERGFEIWTAQKWAEESRLLDEL